MNIIFLGADVPSNRLILEKMAVTHMGVSVWGLIRRGLPKTKTYLLENYFPDNVQIYVYPGLPQNKQFTQQELEEFAADYEGFIADNIDRITLFTEVTHPDMTAEFRDEQRRTVWSEVPDEKFAVVYESGDLESLSTRYLNVCIAGDVLDDPQTDAKVRKYSSQHGTHFHALGMAKMDSLRKSPFATAATLAWMSPMLRGETIIWHANTLTRYPKRMKEQARSRYKAVYEQAGLDFDKILEDDAIEVSKLAIWSYQQFCEWNNKMVLVTKSDDSLPPKKAETTPSDVTKSGSDMRKLDTRNPDEFRTLPGLNIEVTRTIETGADGVDVLKEVPTIKSDSTSLRMCNTCIVKDVCPAFKADSLCAFKLPVEVRTKEQLKSLIDAFLEIQGQRAMFAKFAEDLNGGYPDPNVGLEFDRFFKMLKAVNELSSQKDTLRVSIERQGSAGMMSALFGDKAQILNELPNGGMNEQQVNEVIRQINPDNS